MSETIERPNLDDFRDRAARNVFAGEERSVTTLGALAMAEQQRGVAEVQARMLIARANPRNQIACMDAILRDCTRPSLAKDAMYAYARGGSSVSGASIRLAEAIARRWGNIASGIKEVSRGNGYSECVAYAWDLESGYYDERQFQVKHWRDTKSGGYQLTDERDIYELIANMGQRRKRAVLLTVIPGDVVEAAEDQCEETLKATADTSPEGLAKLAGAFQTIGVSRAQLEKRCQCRLEAIRPAQVVQLRKIYASIKDEMSLPDDWFESGPSGAWQQVEQRHAATAAQTTAQEARQRAPRQTKATAAKEAQPPSETPGSAATHQDTAEASPPRLEPSGEPVPAGHPPAGSVATPGTTDPAGGGAFEHWLLDESGNPIGGQPVTDPRVYALRMQATWQLSKNREALVEQNTDGMDAASEADARAAEIIATIRTPAPAAPVVIVLKDGRDGPVWQDYLREFNAAVGTLMVHDYLDFYAANRETMEKAQPSTYALLMKAMVARAKLLSIEPPAQLSAPLTAAAGDKDRRIADNILEEIARCTTVNQLEMYSKTGAVSTPRSRWQAEGKTALFDEVTAAFHARAAALKGDAP
jgi:hypothetical protein